MIQCRLVKPPKGFSTTFGARLNPDSG